MKKNPNNLGNPLTCQLAGRRSWLCAQTCAPAQKQTRAAKPALDTGEKNSTIEETRPKAWLRLSAKTGTGE